MSNLCFVVMRNSLLYLAQFLKLQQVKSEIRYAPNMILVKLTGSHDIAQITIRISEIKRTKMVSARERES